MLPDQDETVRLREVIRIEVARMTGRRIDQPLALWRGCLSLVEGRQRAAPARSDQHHYFSALFAE